MTERNYSHYRTVFQNHPMPFAYVDLELLDRNIQAVEELSQTKVVRVASKSVRSVTMLKHILKTGENFKGSLCFTAAEAVYLASQGLSDLLVAYPTWEPEQITAVTKAVKAGKAITLMIDCLEHVDHIETIARRREARLPLCLDVDLSLKLPGLHFGARRSPIQSSTEALRIAERIANSKHLWLDGVLGYEAQIAGVGDAYPTVGPKNHLIRWLKRRSILEIAQRRAQLVHALKSQGHSLRFVNGGGTGSIKSTCAEDAVTEVTVGSAFYSPGLFDYFRDFQYLPAAGFTVQIVRKPEPHIYTCLGGGYIGSGASGRDKLPLPYLPHGARLSPLEGAGEVQTPVIYTGKEVLRIGDPIFMRHSKAGELCERFNSLLLVSEAKVVNEVNTYRGDGQCFL